MPLRRLATLLTLAALFGCTDDDGPDRLQLERQPSATTTSAVTPADAVVDLLVARAVPGFQPAGGGEPLDLQAAADLESDVDGERQALTSARFRRGASRTWAGPSDAIAYVAVYELGDPAGAEAYLAAVVRRLEQRGGRTFDEVAGIDRARGFTTIEDSFTAHAVAFTRGPLYVLVVGGAPDASVTPEAVAELSRRQDVRVTARS